MKFWLRALFAWAITMSVGVAVAQQMCPEYRLVNPDAAGDWAPSKDAAFASWQGKLTGGSAACGSGTQTWTDTGVRNGEDGGYVTRVYSNCSTTGVGGFTQTPINYGYFTTRTVECATPQCSQQVGTDHTVKNITIGYTRTPDGNAVVGTPFNPWNSAAGACDGTCEVTFGTAVSAWTSTTPTAAGLYRQSVDMQTQRNGNSCNTLTPALDPVAHNVPPCPGVVGEVNGKPYCVGTAAAPVANDKPITPPPVPPTEGNPTAGSSPTPGTDRTPTEGKGGPEGGPKGGSGSGSGTGGTVILPGAGGTGKSGTIAKPADGTEQAECGAPGQPKCSIDETGTPTKADGTGSFSNAGKAVDDTEKGIKDALASIKDQAKPEWTWSFQLPTGCTTYTLDEFNISIDMCRWQPMIHDLMALVWISATIWFGISIVGRTLGGGH